MDHQRSPRIELLKEHNFGSWFVNIRAELRKSKLWEYTQGVYQSESGTATMATTEETGESPQITKKEEKAIKQWEEKSQDAADLMTPTISPGIQLLLTDEEFNDGFLMLSRLRTKLQPTGSSEFMRLSKEYYTIQFKSFKSVPQYLTHIKVLEEKIDNTKVVLNTDNRTILCLAMSLPQEFQYLVQIWAVTPSITAEKARQMVLEATRQHNQVVHNPYDPDVRALKAGREPCEHCESLGHPSHLCYSKFPDRAPEWYKLKMKEQSKGKGNGAEKAREFQAKLAREDDFMDGTHISC